MTKTMTEKEFRVKVIAISREATTFIYERIGKEQLDDDTGINLDLSVVATMMGTALASMFLGTGEDYTDTLFTEACRVRDLMITDAMEPGRRSGALN